MVLEEKIECALLYLVAPILERETACPTFSCPFPFINDVLLIGFGQPWGEVGLAEEHKEGYRVCVEIVNYINK